MCSTPEELKKRKKNMGNGKVENANGVCLAECANGVVVQIPIVIPIVIK